MRLIVLIVAASFLCCGCDVRRQDTAGDFSCNEDQLRLVEIEYEICSRSGYLDSYCFMQAKKTRCKRISNGTE